MKTAAAKIQNVKREERKAWSAGLKRAIEEIRGRGLSTEQIAVDMRVTNDTVGLWAVGHRLPKYPTLRYIEQTYGVKIL